ncbi:MAG: hypothetical protein K2M95_01520 [Clostridiales bacterium]|nr:hypothetical protein [Clostridiales bacterium]
MIQVSDLPGKSLISLADAATLGYIANVWFDSKLQRARVVEIICDDDDRPERSYADFAKITCEGDAAVIPSAECLKSEKSAIASTPCPINRPCYNQSGKSLGTLRGILLENCNTVKIVCENGNFTPKELLSLGADLCIFNDTGKPIKIVRPKKTAVQTVAQAAPQASDAPTQDAPEESGVQTPPPPQAVTVSHAPGEPVKNYSFLLGKPVHTAVMHNGATLIPAGTVVDEEVIELARKYGKLVQLALRAF